MATDLSKFNPADAQALFQEITSQVSGDATASVVARREETRHYPAASRSDTAFAINHHRGGGGCSICHAVAECSRLPTLRGRGPLRSSSAAATDSPSLTGLRHG